MATQSEFIDRYRKYSSAQLLEIIENPGDYQEAAVAAARAELDRRELTADQLNEARHLLSAKQEEERAREALAKAPILTAKAVGRSIWRQVDPIRTTTSTTRKVILAICLVLAVQYLTLLVKQFPLLLYVLERLPDSWNLSVLLGFLPLIALPVSLFLFWKGRKWGWILLVLHMTYFGLGSLWGMVNTWRWEPSGMEGLDMLYRSSSPASYLLSVLFFGGILFYICRRPVPGLYGISDKQALWIFGAIALLLVFPWLGLLLG